jgi:hypothetical protein
MAGSTRPGGRRAAQKNVQSFSVGSTHIPAVRICYAGGTLDEPVYSDKESEPTSEKFCWTPMGASPKVGN